MTDELKERIERAYREEMHDRDCYLSMADCAEEEGMARAAGVIRDIAHDECTHVDALKKILNM